MPIYEKARPRPEKPTWFWLSFLDLSRPDGEKSLGVVITRALDAQAAIVKATVQVIPDDVVETCEDCEVGVATLSRGVPLKRYINRWILPAEAKHMSAGDYWITST